MPPALVHPPLRDLTEMKNPSPYYCILSQGTEHSRGLNSFMLRHELGHRTIQNSSIKHLNLAESPRSQPGFDRILQVL
jgi:hypothetical protein